MRTRIYKVFKSFIVVIILVQAFSASSQQQPQFTHFDEAQVFFNPSTVGLNDWFGGRLLGRWQWVGFEGAPTTYAASVEYGHDSKQIGTGIGFIFDETAEFQNSIIQLNASYRIKFKKDQFISMGLSGVINSLSQNLSDVFVLNDETLFSSDIQETKFNTGLGVYYQSSNWWAGLSVPYMLNSQFEQEGVKFFNQRRHYYLQFGHNYTINPELELISTAQVVTTSGSAINWNTTFVGWYQDLVGVGLGTRNVETMNFLFKTKLKDGISIGYAYDMVINDDLSQLANSSHEVILTYNTSRFTKTSSRDKDGDGVKNKLDKCPNVYGSEINNGCPLPDLDDDGVPDVTDKCPEISGPIALAGCPDSDGDGVIDKIDECPNNAGKMEDKGCPDTDGDGVHDDLDLCPLEPGFTRYRGCPDTDGDRIIDLEDDCPTISGSIENNGCPPVSNKAKYLLKSATSAIVFEEGEFDLNERAKTSLNRIANELINNEIYNLRISVYSDNSGDAISKYKLTQRRADEIKKYLISRGVDAARLDAKGFGGANPVSENFTSEGRAKNNRVEFDIFY